MTVLTIADIREVPCVRVSTASARGRAAKYPYWGVARYVVRVPVGLGGRPSLVARAGASATRRSERLAYADAAELAEREGCWITSGSPGHPTAEDLTFAAEHCVRRGDVVSAWYYALALLLEPGARWAWGVLTEDVRLLAGVR